MVQRKFLLFPLILISSPALAQRTADNAVTAAGDAFGKAVGNERIGLYSSDDVRGFSPVDAGNARIEGLFFTQVERPSSRLIEGTTIRVGIAAQGYPFPAPTGIVDYRLTLPSGKPTASIELERGPYGGAAGSVEAKYPILGERLGISSGVGFRHMRRPEGGAADFRGYATTLLWRPYDKAEVIAFAGGLKIIDDEATSIFFPAGNNLPPKIKRRQFIGQAFTDRNSRSISYGLVTKLPLGAWRVDAGLFRAKRDVDTSFADLFIGVRSDGSASEHRIIADGDNLDDAISGEARVSRSWGKGKVRHTLTASVKGRDVSRDFGGTQRLNFGASTIARPIPLARPTIVLGVNDQDNVRQLIGGAAYGFNWAGRGSFDLSLAKTRYRKSVDFSNPALVDTVSRANPLLYSGTGSVILTKQLALYGGIVRGLEDAPIAPDIAVNRNEAPPAILTRQIDAGLRFAVTPKLTLVAGAFSVRKPYFNLDAGRLFRQLGTVTNKGIEVSLAGSPAKGVTIIAGSVFLDPKISGEAVTSGQIAPRPVGSVTRRSVANIDWRPEGKSDWSFDLALESLSARTANATNTLSAPPRETLALGTRYRFKLGTLPALIRFQATNIFNDYGFQVSSSGGFAYSAGRTFITQLVVDL
jgi:iron complex outermembrane recepter protein